MLPCFTLHTINENGLIKIDETQSKCLLFEKRTSTCIDSKIKSKFLPWQKEEMYKQGNWYDKHLQLTKITGRP
jgi:hypothetical protein